MVETPTLQAFEAVFAQKSGLWDKYQPRVAGLQEQLEAAIRAAYRAANPKSRVRDLGKMQDALGKERTAEITAPFRETAKAAGEAMRAEEDALEAQLIAMAQQLEPPQIEGLHLRHTVWHGTYSSQGYGAAKYARANAQREADAAIRCGLQAEVREVNKKTVDAHWGPRDLIDFGVFVNTTEAGWEIVRRKPGLPLREWLAACWKAGTNPRVMNPFLPHGLEEKLGVDYFGNLYDPPAKKALQPEPV